MIDRDHQSFFDNRSRKLKDRSGSGSFTKKFLQKLLKINGGIFIKAWILENVKVTMYINRKKEQKILRKLSFKKPINKNLPYHNPIKEGLKTGFRFVKLFWALIVLFIIILLLLKYGERMGIRLDW